MAEGTTPAAARKPGSKSVYLPVAVVLAGLAMLGVHNYDVIKVHGVAWLEGDQPAPEALPNPPIWQAWRGVGSNTVDVSATQQRAGPPSAMGRATPFEPGPAPHTAARAAELAVTFAQDGARSGDEDRVGAGDVVSAALEPIPAGGREVDIGIEVDRRGAEADMAGAEVPEVVALANGPAVLPTDRDVAHLGPPPASDLLSQAPVGGRIARETSGGEVSVTAAPVVVTAARSEAGERIASRLAPGDDAERAAEGTAGLRIRETVAIWEPPPPLPVRRPDRLTSKAKPAAEADDEPAVRREGRRFPRVRVVETASEPSQSLNLFSDFSPQFVKLQRTAP